jgi:tRNA(His) guanylyltransferase
VKDSIGDRMKKYERVSAHQLTPNSCVFVRVDGRAFHTFTRDCVRPFDHDLMASMRYAAIETSREIQGFKLAYTQSDECTFLLTDFDTIQTEGWFGYDLSKLVSLSASLFTAHFNKHYDRGLATFDSRAFVVPLEDAPNVFIWRQRDWERNSLQMLARAHFSHKRLHEKGRRELHDLLMLEKGINWAELDEAEKNGTVVWADRTTSSPRLDYTQIADYLTKELAREDQ